MKILGFLIFIFSLFITPLFSQIQLGQDIDGEAINDYSGAQIALSADGMTIVIGADQNDGSGINSGHVRVYSYDPIANSWIPKGLDINGESSGNYCGSDVDISDDGNTVVIGAKYDNNASGGAAGQTRVFRFISGAWVQLGMDIDGEAAFDYSGYAVSMSSDGNKVAIGSTHNDGSFNDAGSVRVYQYNGSNWLLIGQDIDGEAAGDHSGWSVSLSGDGNTVAIGAKDNDGNGVDSGQVRVYNFNGTSWIQKGQDIDGKVAGDWAGFSVEISNDGNTTIVGSPYNSDLLYQMGHARVFQYDGTSWNQLGQDLVGEQLVDWVGWSSTISDNASTIAVGAIRNDGAGGDAGHARVYILSGSTWVQRGSDFDADAPGDWAGHSVALSGDGNIFAMGALNHDNYTGHVKIYSFCANNYAGPNQLTGVENGVNDYETDGSIESDQIIGSAAMIDYDSKTGIDLLQGFEATVGAMFHAFIDGCPGLY